MSIMLVSLISLMLLIQPIAASRSTVQIIETATDVAQIEYNAFLDVSETVRVFVPDQICTPINCPFGMGTCDGTCTYINDYKGLLSYPNAVVTSSCTLDGECSDCNGVLGNSITAYSVAQEVSTSLDKPLCSSSNTVDCVGVAGVPPLMFGSLPNYFIGYPNATSAVWGAGLSSANGLCYKLTGSTGNVAYVAITDRCGGYCSCVGTVNTITPCSNCVANNYSTVIENLCPNCQCVGTAGLTWECSSYDLCDWCSASNHPHFHVDIDTMGRLCDDVSAGSCTLAAVEPISNCIEARSDWPELPTPTANC